MPTSRLALIVPLLLAAAGARGAVLERVCTTPGHDPRPVAVRIDTAVGTVVQDGLQLRNGVHAEHLPDLGYFVSMMDGSVTWGARNLATGATYYHYALDTAANTLSYDAEGGLHTEATCAPIAEDGP